MKIRPASITAPSSRIPTCVIRFLALEQGQSAASARSVLVAILDGKTVVTNSGILDLALKDCDLITVLPCGRFNQVRLTGKPEEFRKYLAKQLKNASES